MKTVFTEDISNCSELFQDIILAQLWIYMSIMKEYPSKS